MSDTIIATAGRSKEVRGYYEPGDKYEISAVAKLHALGEQAPYFSVTGELRNLKRHGDNAIEACGCMHEEIVKHFPELEPVVRVHLATENGIPMHALANGAYWLGFTQFQDAQYAGPNGTTATMPYLPHFASTWQVTEEQAQEAYDYCVDFAERILGGDDDVSPIAIRKARTEALYVLYVAMLPIWQEHADQALAVIKGTA